MAKSDRYVTPAVIRATHETLAMGDMRDAAGVWLEMEDCLQGRNGYGGDVAEIYAYRLLPPGPINTSPLEADGRLAAHNLERILRRFLQCHLGCEIAIDEQRWNDGMQRWNDGMEIPPFCHRIHIAARMTSATGDRCVADESVQKTGPISPDDVGRMKTATIPDVVFETINAMIVREWSGAESSVSMDQVLSTIATKLGLTQQEVINNGWLHVEQSYRDAGWAVTCNPTSEHPEYEVPRLVFRKAPVLEPSAGPLHPDSVGRVTPITRHPDPTRDMGDMSDAAGVWRELEDAMRGCNRYGGHVAEIYAYRVLPTGPILNPPSDARGRVAAANLARILRRFLEFHPACKIGVDGRRWLEIQPFCHRVRVDIGFTDADADPSAVDDSPLRAGPISPDDVHASDLRWPSDDVRWMGGAGIPAFVFNMINAMIARQWTGTESSVSMDAVLGAIAAMEGVTPQVIINRGWLQVEEIYRDAGWVVSRPDVMEYSASRYFIFRKKS